jgi:hypothetical protein
MVPTGTSMFSMHLLQRTVKLHRPASGRLNKTLNKTTLTQIKIIAAVLG